MRVSSHRRQVLRLCVMPACSRHASPFPLPNAPLKFVTRPPSASSPHIPLVSRKVEVQAPGGDRDIAFSFVSIPSQTLPTSVPPTSRYAPTCVMYLSSCGSAPHCDSRCWPVVGHHAHGSLASEALRNEIGHIILIDDGFGGVTRSRCPRTKNPSSSIMTLC